MHRDRPTEALADIALGTYCTQMAQYHCPRAVT
jgi:hypothetical protein